MVRRALRSQRRRICGRRGRNGSIRKGHGAEHAARGIVRQLNDCCANNTVQLLCVRHGRNRQQQRHSGQQPRCLASRTVASQGEACVQAVMRQRWCSFVVCRCASQHHKTRARLRVGNSGAPACGVLCEARASRRALRGSCRSSCVSAAAAKLCPSQPLAGLREARSDALGVVAARRTYISRASKLLLLLCVGSCTLWRRCALVGPWPESFRRCRGRIVSAWWTSR